MENNSHFLPFSSSAGLTGSNRRKVDAGEQAMECGPIREVQLGRTRYIVQSHYKGTDTMREKLRRLVLRGWEDEQHKNT
jgi:hypothetical protein